MGKVTPKFYLKKKAYPLTCGVIIEGTSKKAPAGVLIDV